MPKNLTFDQISQTPKPLSDRFVERILTGDYSTDRGAEHSLKAYLDNVPADDYDKQFVKDPEQIIAHRNELSDLVADKLSFMAPADKRDLVGSLKQSFAAKLKHDKTRVANYFRDAYSGKKERYPIDAMDFHGLNIDTVQKGPVNLLDGNVVSNIRANFHMQQNPSGLFVQWTSKKALFAEAQGQKPITNRRIYLNPAIKDSVKVFREIIDQADNSGLAIKGKLLDRSGESDIVASRDPSAQEFSLRGDGIVLYASDQDVDKLLEITAKVHSSFKDAFTGRGLSRVPQKIAEGIGVADDPGISGESTTSHREEALSGVGDKVRDRKDLTREAKIKLFHTLWRQDAIERGINPDNLAFNAKK